MVLWILSIPMSIGEAMADPRKRQTMLGLYNEGWSRWQWQY